MVLLGEQVRCLRTAACEFVRWPAGLLQTAEANDKAVVPASASVERPRTRLRIVAHQVPRILG
jgi:hypothetical protein